MWKSSQDLAESISSQVGFSGPLLASVSQFSKGLGGPEDLGKQSARSFRMTDLGPKATVFSAPCSLNISSDTVFLVFTFSFSGTVLCPVILPSQRQQANLAQISPGPNFYGLSFLIHIIACKHIKVRLIQQALERLLWDQLSSQGRTIHRTYKVKEVGSTWN